MPHTFKFSDEQLATFERRGVLRLPGMLATDRVTRARDYVRTRMAALGLWQDGAWRLDAKRRPVWPQTGVKASRDIGNRYPDAEALIDEPALLEAVDVLLGGRAFDRSMYPRPQLLVTLPNIDDWTVPVGWHCDAPRLASGESTGVQMFTFLEPVAPWGGGTLVIAGSHRLLNTGRFLRSSELMPLLRREPYFEGLFAEGPPEARVALLERTGEVDGVELSLVELTGEPGDVWMMDLRMFHTAAPNALDRPRLMATHRFCRADLMEEISAGLGWMS